MNALLRPVSVVVMALSLGSAAAQFTFVDVSAAAGLDAHVYHNTTNHGLGVNWIDVDSDGWPDLFAVDGFGGPAHLYLNDQGTGTFSNGDALLPVLPDVSMIQSIFADYDNDGDDDIYICVDNEVWFGIGAVNLPDGPPNMLLKNLFVENGHQVIPGQPLFTEVAAGVQVLAPFPFNPPNGYPGYRSFTAGWIDYDGHGWLDLHVGNLAQTQFTSSANANFLFRNMGDGTFADVTVATGLGDPGTGELMRATLAMVSAQLNGDVHLDMYVVNVGAINGASHHDFLWLNSGNGGFQDVMPFSPGVGDDSQAGMGIDIADYDRNGTWDIYITDTIEGFVTEDGNVLYLGNGNGTFQDNIAEASGVKSVNSWGCNFFDADHDGWEDLFVATMNVEDEMYESNHDGTFTDVSAASGFTVFTNGARGSALCDYDKDGDLDIAVLVPALGIVLYENQTAGSPGWLQLDLHGVISNRNAIGTVAALEYAEPGVGVQHQLRQVKGAMSGHAQDAWQLHFGLGAATGARRVDLAWPSGIEQVLLFPDGQQVHTVVETGMRILGDTVIGGSAVVQSVGPSGWLSWVFFGVPGAPLNLPEYGGVLELQFPLGGPFVLPLGPTGVLSIPFDIPNDPLLQGVTVGLQSWTHEVGAQLGGTLTKLIEMDIQ